VCREAVSEGAIDGRGGGHDSLWATGSKKEVFEERRGLGSRIAEAKEWCSGPWYFGPWCTGLGWQLVQWWLRSC
jgi:hypothetical protein